MDVLSTDVSSFRLSAPDKRLPLYMAKMIVALIVESLESLHDLNIIHAGLCNSDYTTGKHLLSFFADLKLDNVPFPFPCDEASIDAGLHIDGPPIFDGEFELA
jgi:hypothetical protein